jgi:HEAT repeat protein
MKKGLLIGSGVLLAVAAAVVLWEPTGVVRGWLSGDSFFQGRPTRYWRKALQDPTDYARAYKTLKDGGAAAVPVLTEILGEAGGADWSAVQGRVRAADLLGALGPGARDVAGPALVAALRDDSREVRSVAATSLGQLGHGGAEAVPLLTELLNSDDRLRATRALASFGAQAKTAVGPLTGLLADPDSEVRWNAARTLGKIGPEARAAVPALVETLNKDDVALVREHAAEALGDIGPDAAAAVPDLARALKDRDARVRRDAVRSLGQIGPAARGAAAAIRELLKDDNPKVRAAAGVALKQVGDN